MAVRVVAVFVAVAVTVLRGMRSFHILLRDAWGVCAYFLRVLTSAGATVSPVLLAQLLRV